MNSLDIMRFIVGIFTLFSPEIEFFLSSYFYVRRVYRRFGVQGLRVYYLSVNLRATLKPACIEVEESNVCG